jgi:glycosyltransferase involved in cell wall biosynthesis
VPRQETIAGLEVHHPRYFLLPKVMMPLHALSMYLFSLPCVLNLNRQWKIDCVDAHFVYPDGLAALLLARHLGVPAVVSARGTDVNEFPKFRAIRPMIRWTLAQSDGVIAVSAALKRAMLELGAHRDKTRVIPNGVDPRRFEPIPPAEARRKLGLAPEGYILLSVGSLIPSKGQTLLIRAFKEIVGRHPGMQLFLLGEGPDRRSLERLVTELGLEDAVHLVGKRPNDELGLWFSAATASCLISTREGWPNVVTESLSCGTPVVASKAGGIPEIIRSPEFGILVDQTIESVTTGLEQALTREWNRELIAVQNRVRTWEHVAAEVEAFLRNAAEARSCKA